MNYNEKIGKDKIAIERGYANWKEYYDWIARDGQKPEVVAQLIESAMDDLLINQTSILEGKIMGLSNRNSQLKERIEIYKQKVSEYAAKCKELEQLLTELKQPK